MNYIEMLEQLQDTEIKILEKEKILDKYISQMMKYHNVIADHSVQAEIYKSKFEDIINDLERLKIGEQVKKDTKGELIKSISINNIMPGMLASAAIVLYIIEEFYSSYLFMGVAIGLGILETLFAKSNHESVKHPEIESAKHLKIQYDNDPLIRHEIQKYKQLSEEETIKECDNIIAKAGLNAIIERETHELKKLQDKKEYYEKYKEIYTDELIKCECIDLDIQKIIQGKVLRRLNKNR